MQLKLGDVPFEDLKIGDEVIDIFGVRGKIGALYPSGTKDPFGADWRCFGGGILFIWNCDDDNHDKRYICITGHAHLVYTYLGGGQTPPKMKPVTPYMPPNPVQWIEPFKKTWRMSSCNLTQRH